MPRTRRWVHFARRAAASREIARASFSRNGRSGKPISPRRCFPASVSTASSTSAIIFRKSGAAIPSPPRRLLSPTREKSKRNRIPSPMVPPLRPSTRLCVALLHAATCNRYSDSSVSNTIPEPRSPKRRPRYGTGGMDLTPGGDGKQYPLPKAAVEGTGMFEKALKENREAIYAILAPASLPREAATPSGGTAFMIAPGLLVTAARCIPGGSDPGNLPRPVLSLVRAPDIGRGTERATLVSLDRGKGLALLRIDAPRSAATLRLLDAPVPVGTPCAYSGFPRLAMDPAPVPGSSLIEMFQGASRLLLREGGRPGRRARIPLRDGRPPRRRRLRLSRLHRVGRGLRHARLPAGRSPLRRSLLGAVDGDRLVRPGAAAFRSRRERANIGVDFGAARRI